jgi:hypothetical protein
MFISSRQRRIDRALSAVLDRINDDHDNELVRCDTWRDIDALTIKTSQRSVAAHDRAKRLRNQWRARIEADVHSA